MDIKENKTKTKRKLSDTSEQTILYRSKRNKFIAGVAGGLGEYFKVDPNIIRLLFIISIFFGGVGAIVYLICWVIIPLEGSGNKIADDYYKENIEEIKQKAKNFTEEFKANVENENETFSQNKPQPQKWLGIILLLIGGIFLLDNLGVIASINFAKFWPLILMAFGLKILSDR